MIARKLSCSIYPRVSAYPTWPYPIPCTVAAKFILASETASPGKAAGIREPRRGREPGPTSIPDLRGRRTWPAHIGTVCGENTQRTMHTRNNTHIYIYIFARVALVRHQFTGATPAFRCSVFSERIERIERDIRFDDILETSRCIDFFYLRL